MKKIISLLLVCLILSTSCVVFANEGTEVDIRDYIQVSNDCVNDVDCLSEESFNIGATFLFEDEFTVETANCISNDGEITVTNLAPTDDYGIIVTFYPFFPWNDGKYYNSLNGPAGISIDNEFPPFYYYSEVDGEVYWINMPIDPVVDSSVKKIVKGESVTLSIPKYLDEEHYQEGIELSEEVLWLMEATIVYDFDNPDGLYGESKTSSYYFKIDNERVNEVLETIVEDEKVIVGQNNFSDVSSTDYFYDSVNWAIEQGITNGTSATTFSPEDVCTQAQILTFLWRANGCPVYTDNDFVGAPKDVYYYEAAKWAYESGLTDLDLDLNSPCTRMDTVYYIAALAGVAWYDPDVTWEPNMTLIENFTDIPDGQGAIIAWALEKGVTNGTSETTFSPDSTCTRGQIVTFLYRAYSE